MDFLTHFGLNRQPFAIDSQTRDYYQAAAPAKVLVRLQGMIIEGEKKEITVSGSSGAGKTITALKLVESLSPDAYSVVLLPEQFIGQTDMVAGIIRSVWGDVSLGDSSRLDALRESGVEAVLILDSADKLSPDMADFVTDLGRNHSVFLIRLGEYQDADVKLDAWGDSAIARLIVHRIKSAGSQSVLFEKKALLQIVRSSEGNPGRAMRLCAASLLATWLSASDQVTLSVAEHVAGGAENDYSETMLEPDQTFTPDPDLENTALEDPAIGIETPPPVPVDQELEAGFDLEETDVDLDLGSQEEEPFSGLGETEGDGDKDDEADLALGALDAQETTDASSLEEDDDFDLNAVLDPTSASDPAQEPDLVTTDATIPVADEAVSLDEETSDIELDDDGDLDAMLAEFGDDTEDEHPGQDKESDEVLEADPGSSDPGAEVAEEEESFDLDAEFADLLDDEPAPSDSPKPVEDAASNEEDDTELDDAFAAFSEEESVGEANPAPETTSEDDDDLDAMLADLTVDEPSPVAGAESASDPEPAVSEEAAPLDDNPSEVIDDDLEAELDDLLKEFGDI